MSDFDVMLDAYSPKQSLRLSLDSIILKYLCSSVVIKGLDDQHTWSVMALSSVSFILWYSQQGRKNINVNKITKLWLFGSKSVFKKGGGRWCSRISDKELSKWSKWI